MTNNNKILIVIPARGGSKGIPRKNIRSLANKPLIYYSINTAKSLSFDFDLYVTSDDDEILSISSKLGAKIIKRTCHEASDDVTLDPVIYSALKQAELNEGIKYEIVITLQPTSPLLSSITIDSAIHKIITNSDIDTIISGVSDTHLTWRKDNGNFIPNYSKRLNRQFLPPVFKETGGFLITRSKFITPENRIGKNINIHTLSDRESIDIDKYSDWSLCEYFLKMKKVLLVVSGNKSVGLGHVYNSMLLANEILDHEIFFLVDSGSKMAFDKISNANYSVKLQQNKNIIDDIKSLNPDIVINDILDTSKKYILSLKKLGYKVINFEDLGEGALFADLTINAIYPEKKSLPNHYFGYEYFILRDEFIFTEKKKNIDIKATKVLLSFGGVDPQNLTLKVLSSIYDECCSRGIEIKVIVGVGYTNLDTLNGFSKIKIISNVNNISDFMNDSDLVFTSAGRTIYEVASLNVPAIVMAQNHREMTHKFADQRHGFLNLGLGENVSHNEIHSAFVRLIENFSERKNMSNLMSKNDLFSGKKRVVDLVKNVVNL